MMDCCTKRSIPQIIFSKALGLLVFLLLLRLASGMPFFTENPFNYQVIMFLNDNILFLVLMSVIFMFGEIFNALRFPFNLPAPLFNAVGSVFLVFFMMMVFGLVGFLTGVRVFDAFAAIAFLLYPLIFAVVLICGYIGIFVELAICKKEGEEGERRPSKKKTWPEVKEELAAAKEEFVNAIDEALAAMRKQKKEGKGRKKKK